MGTSVPAKSLTFFSMPTAIFADPTDFISTWYSWGAAIAFAITFVITLWIFFDSQSNQYKATFWRSVSLLAAILVIPSATLSLFPDLAVGLGPLPVLFAFLGPIATFLALVSLLFYTIGIGVHEPSTETNELDIDLKPVGSRDAEDDASISDSAKKHPEPVTPVTDKRDADSTQVLVQDVKRHKALAWLVALNGPHLGKTYRLRDIADIGRDSKHNDISLDDRTISRQHARIRREHGEFVIYDLVSANGVLVNGEVVERRVLHNGDRILVGQSELGFMQVREESESTVGAAREDETVNLAG